MDRRSHESPMDFEWQTAGPADQTSPFHRLAADYKQEQNKNQAKKRTHGVFESPTKANPPTLTEPASQTYLFSPPAGSRALPSFRSPSFTTPRKFDIDLCSSGAEAASSPDNADAEDTPEGPSRNATIRGNPLPTTSVTQFVGSKSEKKPSLFSQYERGVTPGRGEIRRGKYSDAITRKVRKRRRHEAENRMLSRRDGYESEESDEPGSHRGDRSHPPPRGLIASFFAGLESHPSLPHILSYYTQLSLNLFLVFGFVYIIYSFWSTIRSDVDKASEEARAEVLADMAVCAHQYVENRCEKSNRVPAMESVCNNWERCMNRDPSSVGRARVSAHTFAEIFNSFIEPISYKAMIFSLALAFSCIAASNLAFALIRNKMHLQSSHPHHPPPQLHLPPYPPSHQHQQQQQQQPQQHYSVP
ncbi:MAG: hypothetical protein M1838_004092, partial [Thelocarpon superellum]